jgi:hypothetical protein
MYVPWCCNILLPYLYPDAVIFFIQPGVNKVKGSELLPWPQRLTAPPPRLEEIGISSKNFSEDNVRNLMADFAI